MGRDSKAQSAFAPTDIPASGLKFIREYLSEVQAIAEGLNAKAIDRAAAALTKTRQRGGASALRPNTNQETWGHPIVPEVAEP